MVETLVLLAHLVVAGLIIALVLLQRGKGAEAGTGFGAGASGTVFGARGSANFFSRMTAVLAALFFATSLALAWFATSQSGSEGLLQDSIFQDAESVPGGQSVQPTLDDTPNVEVEGDPEVPPGPGSGDSSE